MKKLFTLLAVAFAITSNAQTLVYSTGQTYGDDWTGWTTPVTSNVSTQMFSANTWTFGVSSSYSIETTRAFSINSSDIDIYWAASTQNAVIEILHSTNGTTWTSVQTLSYGAGFQQQTMVVPTYNPQQENFYLKLKMTGTAGSPPSAIFNNMYINADLGLPFSSNTVSIAPTATQNIQPGANGTTLTATESSTADSREWKWTTTSGSGYQSFTTAQTGTTYTPNFASAGTYYVICESTWSGTPEESNEVQIVVSASANIGELSIGKEVIVLDHTLFVWLQDANYTVDIYDINGRIVVSQPNLKNCDMSALNSGIYFVKLYNADGAVQSVKIVNP
ncbi:MAG: T9SS type A sorting domain-containing protein [Crocinitomicaceae bacterium]|nr:T9SS type A sorting domain-containing protein [Crocinitomicaceae bacterium]